MTSYDIIKQVKEDYCEWIEMSETPDAMVSGILANKVVKLQEHIEYLERRLHYVSTNN